MSNKTVKELKYTAKELGLKGYSKLRKFELIKMIEDYIKNNDCKINSSSIMEDPVPEIKVPILKPIQFTAKGNVKSLKSLADRTAKPIIKNINEFADWLYSYVQNQLEILQTKKLIN